MTVTIPANSIHALSRADWRNWLAEHHAQREGVWLVTYKKIADKPSVSYSAAVEEALCFGWIDSKPNKLDAERTMLYFAPRKRGTGWSRPNKERVARMIETGQMSAAGLAKVRTAKDDGSWSRLDAVEELQVPVDLEKSLADFPDAAKNFEAFPRSVKRGILEWIQSAKKAETRKARVEKTASLASMNQRANQWRARQE